MSLRPSALVLLISACLAACNGPKPNNVPKNGDQPPEPEIHSGPWYTWRLKKLQDSLKGLEPHLVALSPGWGMYHKRVTVRNVWVDEYDVLIETEDRILRALTRKGTPHWHVGLSNEITFRPARSPLPRMPSTTKKPGETDEAFKKRRQQEKAEIEKDTWVTLIAQSYLYRIDYHGNLLEGGKQLLTFVPASDPVSTDTHLFAGSEDRFFYAWDQVNQRYDKRHKLDGSAVARPALSGDRVYFVANDSGGPAILALSLSPNNFFGVVWKKRVYDEVTAPLSIHHDYHEKDIDVLVQGQLVYACGQGGKIYAYSKHSGEIMWDAETQGELRQQPVGLRDRVYQVVETGENKGLWCLNATDAKGGTHGTRLWLLKEGRQVLAVGKNLYVRIEKDGKTAIAVVNPADGAIVASHIIPEDFAFLPTNVHGGQVVLGTRDGFILAAVETE